MDRLAGALVLALAPAAHAAPPHDLLPAPARLEWGQGSLPLEKPFRASLAGPGVDDRVRVAVDRALARLARMGVPVHARSGPRPRVTALDVRVAGPGHPVQAVGEDESYRLTVTPKIARVYADNPLGAMRALETFVQLVRREGDRFAVPAVTIDDRPRFSWRGLLVDPCRRWQPLEVIKRTLDGMAAAKLNVLHWHLTEDQGFRLESKSFPKLHELGSDGLYYTQPRVREVIAYARERGIRVVPEFDLPDHSTSWLVGHPELGSAPGPFALVRQWGIFDNVLDPTREEVYAFLDAFFGEMAALFPDEYVHIGGDEVTPRQWNANPRILDFMYRHELRSHQDLQARFNLRLSRILARHGKKMMGWDEILREDLPRDILVQSWNGAAQLAATARLGVDGILSHGYYLDHMMPASFHYAADPIPLDSTLSAGERRHVLGGEACMWGEFVSSETVDSRVWPRALAVAERLWSPQEVRDVEDMYRRVDIASARLDVLGLTHNTGYEPMLQRLVGPGRPVAPLKVLADVVQPVRIYRRGRLLAFTQSTPLDRLADAARPESLPARRFAADVNAFLRDPSDIEGEAPLREKLSAWRDNHVVLEPILAASEKAAEARSLSRDLSALGRHGLTALDAVRAGSAPDAAWRAQAQELLRGAAIARGEVEIAVVPAVRKLLLAAEHAASLRTLGAEAWNARLDELLVKPAFPPARHE